MRIKELDVFRGFAAMSVVLYHYTTFYNLKFSTDYQWNFSYGWLGVPVFFILSGFVISLTVNRSSDALDFVKKRFIRLFPTFWICLLSTLIIECITGYFIKDLSIGDILMNFAMFGQFFGFKYVDGSYWSLLPELLFYLLIAVLMIIKKIKSYYLINAILLVIGIVHLFSPIPILGKLLTIHYILLFMIGIAFYRIYNEINDNWDYILIVINFAVSTPLYLVNHKHNTNSLVFLYVAFGLIICLYFLFVKGHLKFLSNFKPLLFLGNVSYALYLIHQNIGYIIINKTESLIGRSLAILFAMVISIGLASIITYKIEPFVKPFVRKLLYK